MNQLINGSVTYDNANFSIYNEETRLTHIKVATDKNIYGTKTTEEKITKITLDCNNATFTNAQFKLWVDYEGESYFEDPLGDLTISKNAISDYNLNVLDDFKDVYEEIITEFTLNKYQNHYGHISTWNNYRTTIIDVIPYEKYYIKGKRSGNIRNIFILDPESQDAALIALKNFYNLCDFEFWIVAADRPVDISLYVSQLQLLYNQTQKPYFISPY